MLDHRPSRLRASSSPMRPRPRTIHTDARQNDAHDKLAGPSEDYARFPSPPPVASSQSSPAPQPAAVPHHVEPTSESPKSMVQPSRATPRKKKRPFTATGSGSSGSIVNPQSSAFWEPWSDLRSLHRRKSAGSKLRHQTQSSTPSKSSARVAGPSTASKPTAPHFSSLTRTPTQASKSKSMDAASSAQKEKQSHISTLDRRILRELLAAQAARQQQFRFLGPHPGIPYAPLGVPYPLSYAREIVDADCWDDLWVQQICGSNSWAKWETPPSRV